jgi:hypothetical protein
MVFRIFLRPMGNRFGQLLGDWRKTCVFRQERSDHNGRGWRKKPYTEILNVSVLRILRLPRSHAQARTEAAAPSVIMCPGEGHGLSLTTANTERKIISHYLLRQFNNRFMIDLSYF